MTTHTKQRDDAISLLVYLSNRLATSGRRSQSDPCVIQPEEVTELRQRIQSFREDVARAEGR